MCSKTREAEEEGTGGVASISTSSTVACLTTSNERISASDDNFSAMIGGLPFRVVRLTGRSGEDGDGDKGAC